jgi:hypothetical protein
MEAETGVRFGYIEPQLFSHILETNPNTKEKEEI